jgi:tRNA G18 (ribose-2'-O)-methylase SpoU
VIRVESLDDPRLADYRSLTDRSAMLRAGLFVAEGRIVVERLLNNPRFRVRSVLMTAAALRQFSANDSQGVALSAVDRDTPTASTRLRRDDGGDTPLPPVPVYVAEQSLMNDIVGFDIHRGCVALAERPATRTLAALPLATLNRVLIMEGVSNPDNVGGLFRSAAAFGVDAIILGPGCADPLYRKSIRTSMAATLQVPFVDAAIWPDGLSLVRAAGLTLLALTPASDAIALDQLPRGFARIALLAGAEGDGLSAAALAAADHRVRIPTTDHVDSLNVTVAVSIALHHFSSQPSAVGSRLSALG